MKRDIVIFGSGAVSNPLPGHIYVDHRPFRGVDVVCDLNVTPWPLEDSCALHANATHLFEHLTNFHGAMDELHRILSPGGSLFFEVPHAKSVDLAFSDPDHKRFFTPHSFINYLTVEGVNKHGQFKHAWCFVHLESNNGIIRGHMFPVEDRFLTDDSIAMWEDYKKNYSHI
jgi:predicted SAM-dependent methyltransferase